VGSGTVRCAHGELPVPAPATLLLLKDVPIYSSDVKGELCTPTGAALLGHFVSHFGNLPLMRVSKIGYGTGFKDFQRANVLRVLLGDTDEMTEAVAELSCNLDDMTAEELAFAQERLFALGALDVCFTSIGMKKSRPGIMLTCICKPDERDIMIQAIFRYTTTLGIRESVSSRYCLRRHSELRESGYGPVNVKISEGWGVRREKAEYEDLKRIASENDISLREIKIQGLD
ncbi:MAG: LarC family nickel insertion protein, partial [Oscillospiraceae bacterium]|nr:LarC family nickel insertion protein [Oscillospiraceae bacterium]